MSVCDCVLTHVAVLSSALASEQTYKRSQPDDVEQSTRLWRVEDRLMAEMEDHCVICLQEVSREWHDALRTLFSGQGYDMHFVGYGTSWDGHMGVLVAWSREKYALETTRSHRVGDSVRAEDVPSECKLAPTTSVLGGGSWLVKRAASFIDWATGKPPVYDVLAEAKKRDNCALFVRLRCLGSRSTTGVPNRFWVGTYHMPCVFGSREKEAVAELHAMAIKRISVSLHTPGYALPLVLLGDFNTQPDSVAYNTLCAPIRDPILDCMLPDHHTLRRYAIRCLSESVQCLRWDDRRARFHQLRMAHVPESPVLWNH